MMRPPLSGCNVMLFLLVLFAQELMGKRNKERHNREANKKPEAAPKKCVADYCLLLEYNALELPRQDVQINQEVRVNPCHFRFLFFVKLKIICENAWFWRMLYTALLQCPRLALGISVSLFFVKLKIIHENTWFWQILQTARLQCLWLTLVVSVFLFFVKLCLCCQKTC